MGIVEGVDEDLNTAALGNELAALVVHRERTGSDSPAKQDIHLREMVLHRVQDIRNARSMRTLALCTAGGDGAQEAGNGIESGVCHRTSFLKHGQVAARYANQKHGTVIFVQSHVSEELRVDAQQQRISCPAALERRGAVTSEYAHLVVTQVSSLAAPVLSISREHQYRMRWQWVSSILATTPIHRARQRRLTPLHLHR